MPEDILEVCGTLASGQMLMSPPRNIKGRFLHITDSLKRPVLAEGFIPRADRHTDANVGRGVSGGFNATVTSHPIDPSVLAGKNYTKDLFKKIHACHLIARQFGGKEKPYNLIPMPQTVNERMTKFEAELQAKFERTGNQLYLQVFASYHGEQSMAASILYRVFELKGERLLQISPDTSLAALNS